jgi:hypothetical protein
VRAAGACPSTAGPRGAWQSYIVIRNYHEIFFKRLVTIEELRNSCESSWCPSSAGPPLIKMCHEIFFEKAGDC